MKYIFVFECPAHGVEHQVLCYRAYDLRNLHLWKKLGLTELPIEKEDLEVLRKFIEEKQ